GRCCVCVCVCVFVYMYVYLDVCVFGLGLGFFKRTVQNNKRYTCVDTQSCRIDKLQRKRCPFCRFQKCLSVGMRLEAVRGDRMRGGRNKFGPLYKQDRALKQQKRALVGPAIGGRIELEGFPASPSPPGPGQSPHPPSRPYTWAYRALAPSSDDHEASLFSAPHHCQPSAYPQAPAPPGGPWPHVKSERQASACSGPPAEPSPAAEGPPRDPAALQLIDELRRSEPDELQLRSRILSYLQQEQATRGRQARLSTFGLMYKMADQSLFSLVEWARSCLYFKELKVGFPMASCFKGSLAVVPCIRAHRHAHTQTHIQRHTHTHTQDIRTHTQRHTRTHRDTHTQIHIERQTQTRAHTWRRTRTRVRTRLCLPLRQKEPPACQSIGGSLSGLKIPSNNSVTLWGRRRSQSA
uniref:Nuclear receptor domain-containing protein n=1 Tax=Callorhinchus milii TaxID=7868 RepID=A0A4W3GMH0_CALMI